MPMQSGYKQPQDFNIRLLYLVLLALVLFIVLVKNLTVICMLHGGALKTSNLSLRILVTAKLIASSIYITLDCTRAMAYLATYHTDNPVILETYVGCGVYYWLTSSAQWMVSLMLTWATLKRILNLRHQSFHATYINPRTAVIFVITSAIFALGFNSHYFRTKKQTVNFTAAKDFGINGTHEICLPEHGSSYMTFWQDVWPILDSLIHIVLPACIWLPMHLTIEIHFDRDEKMLAKMAPRERNKVLYKRKRDKNFITDLGWTRAMLYAGLVYIISNLPLNIYLWYYMWDKFYALLYFNHESTRSGLLAFEMMKYMPHLMWFSIYNLTGCDGKKVVPKKTISEHILPIGGSYYSLRSRSTEEARARPSRSTEENRI